MSKKIRAGIPTMFEGVLYRSRTTGRPWLSVTLWTVAYAG